MQKAMTRAAIAFCPFNPHKLFPLAFHLVGVRLDRVGRRYRHYEMRERSYSYSPPRACGRRARSPSPRGHYGGYGRDLPTSLLVRNLSRNCRAEDLRKPFGRFGPIKDIYLPRDYHTVEPRGFGFVQYVDPDDAADAKYEMDRQVLFSRELTVVFAQENRKKPSEMRARERLRSRSSGYWRSPSYSPPWHYRSRSPIYSPSPCYHQYRSSRHSRSPRGRYHRSPSPSYYYLASPRQRHYSRSLSPLHDHSVSPRGRSYRSYVYSRSRSRSYADGY